MLFRVFRVFRSSIGSGLRPEAAPCSSMVNILLYIVCIRDMYEDIDVAGVSPQEDVSNYVSFFVRYYGKDNLHSAKAIVKKNYHK